MKKIVILGAGTAGTMMANKLDRALSPDEWSITVVDQVKTHYYQPGFLFIPFGIYSQKDVVKPKRDFLPPRVRVLFSEIEVIEPDPNRVRLAGGVMLGYDYLIIATGAKIQPSETEGLTGEGWRRNIFDFYTVDGAVALARFLKYWEGGRLVVNVAEMPIKCPVAPLEFVFLADWWFTEQGIREKVEIEYVTPLPAAFTKPRAAQVLGGFLEDKNIKLTCEFDIGEVSSKRNVIASYGEDEINYDLLVTVPTNKGDEVIARSGMGNELNFVPTDKHTLRSRDYENVFVIGDATDLPSSKAGSVAHFEADILLENMLAVIDGKEPREKFDGHANCYIESGFGKGILIDFNYDTEPLPGKFPLPGVGPFSLLEETRMNHYGKMMFRWIYWNLLLRGAELPISTEMMMEGKRY
jgi:sulfide:quinone oxidoreductase